MTTRCTAPSWTRCGHGSGNAALGATPTDFLPNLGRNSAPPFLRQPHVPSRPDGDGRFLRLGGEGVDLLGAAGFVSGDADLASGSANTPSGRPPLGFCPSWTETPAARSSASLTHSATCSARCRAAPGGFWRNLRRNLPPPVPPPAPLRRLAPRPDRRLPDLGCVRVSSQSHRARTSPRAPWPPT